MFPTRLMSARRAQVGGRADGGSGSFRHAYQEADCPGRILIIVENTAAADDHRVAKQIDILLSEAMRSHDYEKR
jgi:hypothetical protein